MKALSSESSRRKAIFFDRDGVINARIKGGYVRHWGEFSMDTKLPSILAEVKRRGYLAIIVTNQRGVGKGLMTLEDLHGIHSRLQQSLHSTVEAQFDDILYCTDADDSSGRRKPSPAMLLEAAEKWNIDLANSWMIGDSASDVEAGKRAGTRTAYLITVHSEGIPPATAILHNLEELLTVIDPN